MADGYCVQEDEELTAKQKKNRKKKEAAKRKKQAQNQTVGIEKMIFVDTSWNYLRRILFCFGHWNKGRSYEYF